jgi:hypothetical protein
MTALPRIPDQQSKKMPLALDVTERRSPKQAKHFNARAQQQQNPGCHLCGEAEEDVPQADQDGGKRVDDPEGEKDFKKDNHGEVDEWD